MDFRSRGLARFDSRQERGQRWPAEQRRTFQVCCPLAEFPQQGTRPVEEELARRLCLRDDVKREYGVKIGREHVNVGKLIHELAKTDLDGKFLADGKGKLRQR